MYHCLQFPAGMMQPVIQIAERHRVRSRRCRLLQNARLLEPLGFLNIQVGYVLGLGADIGLKLVRA